MNSTPKRINDDEARRQAISLHDQSILVEAGAGSGKTAILAGRIAVMLADGIKPNSIAAVTFTELAASELLSRVRDFVTNLSNGNVPVELQVAFPDALSQEQIDFLADAGASIDEITCSTIHSFCQRLIKPYPAEADFDPGATVMDPDQADLIYSEIVEKWLREYLSDDQDSMLSELIVLDPNETVKTVRKITDNLRWHRTLVAPTASPLNDHQDAFQQATADFTTFMSKAGAKEPETEVIVKRLGELASELVAGPNPETPAGLIRILTTRPHPDICNKDGSLRQYRKKTKWGTAAKQAGLSNAEGNRLNDESSVCYDACRDAWDSFTQVAATHILSKLIDEVRPVLDLYSDYKRASARLDFDDLIYSTRDLLRDHNKIRDDLGKRFKHVLVDEFQDTDPLQTEIFWRLCGDPEKGDQDWTQFKIRPGALFLVGDPKQAIYRFRGADVRTYLQARDIFNEQNPDSGLSITTNFRSSASILNFVNERFEGVLNLDGQPGFTALEPFHEDRDSNPCVVAIDVAVVEQDGNTKAENKRDAEAEATADFCARLIGNLHISDRHNGEDRICQPGDIALLAPTGTDLWRYEQELEQHGIPVATQAGKGLYRRQEIQDLIALTRTLADGRDKLALGALLRGPLVGLTEEELLDVVCNLPRSEEAPDRIPYIHLGIEPADINHELLRDVLKKLQSLYRRRNTTTPHELLSQAVDEFKVRPILLNRHRGQAERAIANVDLYLSMSTSYSVRGLQAFADAMTEAWSEEERVVEGRPDAQEEAVSLVTMHAAKGLEWPIVIPINTMTGVKAPDKVVIDRETETFFCPIMGVNPDGAQEVYKAEKGELERERVRLWYVATTRARELLVLPRLDTESFKSSWINLVDMSLSELPNFDVSKFSAEVPKADNEVSNDQTRTVFMEEAKAIASQQKKLVWNAPSRSEGNIGKVLQKEEAEIWISADDDRAEEINTKPQIQGGRERGQILHKLMEEVLTGETAETKKALAERAAQLIHDMGQSPVTDPAKGLSIDELVDCVVQTLALPEIADLRPGLLPEFPVYAADSEDEAEVATVGIVDALKPGPDGHPAVVIDWKSDVEEHAETLEHYRAQISEYLEMTGAERGLIVMMTSGNILTV